ncbi:MAG: cytochrome c [Desulfomonile tiedjei]|uniref:Cytochrome c n=1 Tax=Desulfomonile tiedjei TaxID=2358 RepID=A0A9D6V8J6_9BACT|nr:cytochrome c [Desulfomonile tiedjei]
MDNAIRWPRVKELLDSALERWKAENGRDPRMRGAHDGHIGWETKEELASSSPYEKQLIDPAKVGNGKAEETNLVRILRGPIGGYRRMPSGGPYLSPNEIKEISEWINAGMPD